MINRIKLTLLYFFILILAESTAQSKVKHIEVTDGLSQGMIFDIVEDQHGYIWFATFNGLNRYNGYEIEVITSEPFQSNQLNSSETLLLEEDSQGFLWIGTNNGGLFVRCPESEKVYPVHFDSGNSYDIEIKAVVEDKDGNIWIASTYRLYQIKRAALSNRKAQIEATQIYEIKNENRNSIILAKDAKGEIYLSKSDEHILKYNTQNHDFEHFTTLSGLIEKFGWLDDRRLWVTGEDDLIIINGNETQHYPYPPDAKGGNPNLYYHPETGVAWITFEFSPYLYCIDLDKSNPTFTLCLRLNDHEYPTTVLVASQKLWIGTNGYGVRYLDFNTPTFSHLVPQTSIKWIGELAQDAIVYSGLGDLHCANGCDAIQPLLTALSQHSKHLRSIKPSRVHGGYWVIYGHPLSADNTEKTVALVTPSGQIVQQWVIAAADIHYGASVEDPSGALWLGGRKGVFIKVSIDKNKAQLFDFSYVDTPYRTAYKTCRNLILDETGTLWKSTPFGLECFTPRRGNTSYRIYQYDSKNPQTLSNNSVTAVIPDPTSPKRHLWIATAGGGLNHFDRQTETFSYFSIKDGLPDNVIYAIVPNDSLLWMSTNRGIVAYNPHTKGIQHYTAFDGIQHDEFNTGAFLSSHFSDKIYFGGINGISSFSPSAFRRTSFVPRLHIEALTVKNAPLDHQPHLDRFPIEDVAHEAPIHLSWNQNEIEIQYAALAFSNHNVKYRYMLSGIHDDWIYAGHRRYANFNSLPPGHYTFTVESTNTRGEWSGNIRELHIRIHSPWWATTWAYLIYFAVGISLVYQLIQTYQKRLIRQHEQQLKTQAIQQLKLVDKLKDAFFTNITHELRTPLQLIIAPLRQAIDRSAPWETSVQLAHKSALQLLDHVNELIDMAKYNNGQIKIENSQQPIKSFLEEVVAQFTPQGALFQVKLEADIQLDEQLAAQIPTSQWLKILNNLLSNAIKFSHPNSTVQLVVAELPHQQLEIKVIDQGIGIHKRELSTIFDRYYRTKEATDHDPKGAGIGLAFTKELIDTLGGSITIKSVLNKGTTVTVTLPYQVKTTAPTVLNQLDNTHTPLINPHQKIILLVEDNIEIQHFIAQSLALKGYSVLQASNGKEGLALAQEHIPDLIISDVMMPVMDGWAFAQAVKADEKIAHIDLIMLTAKIGDANHLKSLYLGADRFLTKPIDIAILHQQIENIFLQKQRYQLQLRTHILAEDKTATTPLPDSHSNDEAFIQNLKQLTMQNLKDESFNVDKLAQLVKMSRSQLYRKVQALIDISPSTLLREIKMNYARNQLKSGQFSISEVAYNIGFNNPKYFSTVFRQTFGYPPSDALPPCDSANLTPQEHSTS